MIRRVVVTAGVVLSTASLCGCIMVSGNPPMLAQADSTASAPPAAPASRAVTHGIVGEKLTLGAWTVTIEEAARTGKGVGGQQPGSGEDLLLITAGFYNDGTDSLEVRPQDFKLVDGSGKPIAQAKTSQAAYNASSMRPLQPRFGTSTIFVYKVPKGSQHYAFVFTPPGQNTQLEWRVP